MKVWAVTMMRDEEDVAYNVLRHLDEEGVDGIVVADNLSTDNTRAELDRAAADLDCDVYVCLDDDPAYRQSEKMTHLCGVAASLGADWIVPFDADELWVARSGRLGHALRKLPRHVNVCEAELLNHFCTSDDDLADPNPFTRLAHRSPNVNPLPKVAFKWQPECVVWQGNHGVSYQSGRQIVQRGELLAHHFPVRSGDHLVRKARNGADAYAASNLPESEGAHWRGWGKILDTNGPQAMLDVFAEHYFYEPDDLIFDPAPWCRWAR